MALARLVDYLDSNHVQYVVITHSPAFTAQCIAGLTHIPGRELAKAVMVWMDGRLAMAVLPATCRLDLAALRKAARAEMVILASEEEFFDKFPECETGAMPPFGNLYGMMTYADEALARDREVAFNAGTHRELIRMSWEDYARLAEPMVLRIAMGPRAQAA